MANLIRIADGIDVSPFLAELEADPLAWYDNVNRQMYIGVQQHTQSIRLRTAKTDPSPSVASSQDILESQTLSQYQNFPEAWKFCTNYTASQNGMLGWVSYIKLFPRKQIYPHRDDGLYYALRDRYHLVVKSVKGSILRVGSQTVTMYPGEFWVFNNKLEHEVFNPSDEDRIHLVFDMFPNPGSGYFTNTTINIQPDNPE